MYIVYANIYSGLCTLLASAPMLSITHDAWQSVFRRIVQVSNFLFSNTIDLIYEVFNFDKKKKSKNFLPLEM